MNSGILSSNLSFLCKHFRSSDFIVSMMPNEVESVVEAAGLEVELVDA